MAETYLEGQKRGIKYKIYCDSLRWLLRMHRTLFIISKQMCTWKWENASSLQWFHKTNSSTTICPTAQTELKSKAFNLTSSTKFRALSRIVCVRLRSSNPELLLYANQENNPLNMCREISKPVANWNSERTYPQEAWKLWQKILFYISQKRIQDCLNLPVESGLVVWKKASTSHHPFTTIDLCVGIYYTWKGKLRPQVP